jgi:hypothetical protein
MDRLSLLNELTGLEAAKRLIDNRIEELTQLLLSSDNFSAPKTLKRLPVGDPTGIGWDSLGRIIPRRNLTAEQRQAKRVLIKKISAARLASPQVIENKATLAQLVERLIRNQQKPLIPLYFH